MNPLDRVREIIERRDAARTPDVIQERRVCDTVKPGEELRPSVEVRQGRPSLLVSLLCQIGGQVAVSAQAEQRREHRRVSPLDHLLRRGTIAAADGREHHPFVPPAGDHVVARRRG